MVERNEQERHVHDLRSREINKSSFCNDIILQALCSLRTSVVQPQGARTMRHGTSCCVLSHIASSSSADILPLAGYSSNSATSTVSNMALCWY